MVRKGTMHLHFAKDWYLHETNRARPVVSFFFPPRNSWCSISLLRTLMSTAFEEKAGTKCLDAYLIGLSVLPPTARVFSVSLSSCGQDQLGHDKVADTNLVGYQAYWLSKKSSPYADQDIIDKQRWWEQMCNNKYLVRTKMDVKLIFIALSDFALDTI